MRTSPKNSAKLLGRGMVTDPTICHGRPMFRGTRIVVEDVLDQVSRSMEWEAMIEEGNGNITKEAIAEAVQLANQVLKNSEV